MMHNTHTHTHMYTHILNKYTYIYIYNYQILHYTIVMGHGLYLTYEETGGAVRLHFGFTLLVPFGEYFQSGHFTCGLKPSTKQC